MSNFNAHTNSNQQTNTSNASNTSDSSGVNDTDLDEVSKVYREVDAWCNHVDYTFAWVNKIVAILSHGGVDADRVIELWKTQYRSKVVGIAHVITKKPETVGVIDSAIVDYETHRKTSTLTIDNVPSSHDFPVNNPTTDSNTGNNSDNSIHPVVGVDNAAVHVPVAPDLAPLEKIGKDSQMMNMITVTRSAVEHGYKVPNRFNEFTKKEQIAYVLGLINFVIGIYEGNVDFLPDADRRVLIQEFRDFANGACKKEKKTPLDAYATLVLDLVDAAEKEGSGAPFKNFTRLTLDKVTKNLLTPDSRPAEDYRKTLAKQNTTFTPTQEPSTPVEQQNNFTPENTVNNENPVDEDNTFTPVFLPPTDNDYGDPQENTSEDNSEIEENHDNNEDHDDSEEGEDDDFIVFNLPPKPHITDIPLTSLPFKPQKTFETHNETEPPSVDITSNTDSGTSTNTINPSATPTTPTDITDNPTVVTSTDTTASPETVNTTSPVEETTTTPPPAPSTVTPIPAKKPPDLDAAHTKIPTINNSKTHSKKLFNNKTVKKKIVSYGSIAALFGVICLGIYAMVPQKRTTQTPVNPDTPPAYLAVPTTPTITRSITEIKPVKIIIGTGDYPQQPPSTPLENMFDGDISTAWIHVRDHHADGNVINITLDKPYDLRYLEITPGFPLVKQSREDMWTRYRHVDIINWRINGVPHIQDMRNISETDLRNGVRYYFNHNTGVIADKIVMIIYHTSLSTNHRGKYNIHEPGMTDAFAIGNLTLYGTTP